MMNTMGYFNKDSNNRSGRDNRGGGRGFGGGGRSSFGGGRDDRPREMFKTVCSNCNKSCEVPFRPTTGKPVYCSDCFETMGGRSERPERSDRPRFDSPRRDDKQSVPFQDNSKQLNDLNAKLDKIILLLTPKKEEVEVKTEIKEVLVEKIKTPKDKQSLPLRGKKVTAKKK